MHVQKAMSTIYAAVMSKLRISLESQCPQKVQSVVSVPESQVCGMHVSKSGQVCTMFVQTRSHLQCMQGEPIGFELRGCTGCTRKHGKNFSVTLAFHVHSTLNFGHSIVIIGISMQA